MATTWAAAAAVSLTVIGMSLPPDDPAVQAVVEPAHNRHGVHVAVPGDGIGLPRAQTGNHGVQPSDRVGPRPLAGLTIAIDPGHQLGNSRHARQTNRRVPAGGFMKACNTTGTATKAGFAEATFNFRVAQRLRTLLELFGARVIMTRYHNSSALWGPCVDYRGRFGDMQHADLKISIHGDGSYVQGHGFHVIAPTWSEKWTADIYRASKALAYETRHALIDMGFAVSNYSNGRGIEFRDDLATLNLSDIPVVLVECGNMRNPHDARVMSSQRGRNRYASALMHAIRAFLDR
jgi:N-acetylmuramoyl-L-alanine amidase